MFPQDAAERYYTAQRLFRRGKAVEALRLLDEIDRGAPNHPEIMYARALCMQGLALDREGLLLCNKLYTMHNDRRGLELRQRWYDPPHGVCVAPQETAPAEPAPASLPVDKLGADFFRACAVIAVGVDNAPRPAPWRAESLPAYWRDQDFDADDLNRAMDHAWDIALPNAIRAVKAARRLGLHIVVAHWGFRFPDAMDLDPQTLLNFRRLYGPDTRRYPGHPEAPGTGPAAALDIHASDYVLPKTSENVFSSTNLHFLLANLGVRQIALVGGPLESCLLATAASAKALGYQTCAIDDAIYCTRSSQRKDALASSHFAHVLSVSEFTKLLQRLLPEQHPAA